MGVRASIALSSLLVLVWASPASAMKCQAWNRLPEHSKPAEIERMIQDAVSGSGGRSYHVDRGAIGRCLHSFSRDIQYDFDGACGDRRTAGMSALRNIFKSYIWSCVR